jgi:hypothetical protein
MEHRLRGWFWAFALPVLAAALVCGCVYVDAYRPRAMPDHIVLR